MLIVMPLLAQATGTPGSARRQEVRQEHHPRPPREMRATVSTGLPPHLPPAGPEHTRSPPGQGRLYSVSPFARSEPTFPLEDCMKTLLLILSLSASSLAATPSVPQVYATDDAGMAYPALYTESSWMALEVPLSTLGGAVPSDLNLAASGLPDGVSLTLGTVKTRGAMAIVHVKVARSAAAKTRVVNSLATVEVRSGSRVLSTMAVPVMGAAYGQ
ncbi:hypothetical protein [Deinococcus koreensis]|uniref:Uncharacterized protein n=1 Tax=Deinococcus koreensis TaxID=2054903 RepID=A0A2K3UW41_9DEIO|nr:hypothetical protein [Deinococcus koreensis]PNY80741.1 hypothetical protein CVO96_04600 [Deinococcus koreensis]